MKNCIIEKIQQSGITMNKNIFIDSSLNIMNTFYATTLLLIISGGQNLQAKEYYFTGYDSFCGLPVFTGSNPQFATAERDNQGNPIIHVDPSVLSNMSNSRIFTLAHECAHHLLGHTTQLGHLERYSGGTRKQELEADCWAAQKLSQFGQFSDLEFQTLKNLSDGHFAGNGYPSGNERAHNIYACATGNQMNTMDKPMNVNTTRCEKRMVPKVVPIQTIQVRQVPGPCNHVAYGPYGHYQVHQFDYYTQQVPVTTYTTQMVEETYCN
jgi:hypothetical protein